MEKKIHMLSIENTEQIIYCCNAETDIYDILSLIATIVLGVVTIIVGRYIYQKRSDAQYGFYIDLMIYIERIKFFFSDGEFDGITAYLCSDTLRNQLPSEGIPVLTTAKAQTSKELYIPLCKDFLDFISNAENNIAPKIKKERFSNRKENARKWYVSIMTMVDFIQKSMLLEYDITPYAVTDEKKAEYISDLQSFENSLKYIEDKLKLSIGIGL